MQPHAPAAVAALLGLDGADATHPSGLHAAGAARPAVLGLAHRPAALAAGGQTRRTRFHGPPVAVGLARQPGPRMSALRASACLVRLPVPPLPVATERDACPPRRATAAPTDAARQGARLLPHRATRTLLSPHSPTRRACAPRGAPRRRLGDTGRRPHRVLRALTHALPHVLQGVQDNKTGRVGDCLPHWPTRTAGPRARRPPLARCCRAHHVRAADRLQTRLEALQRAGALTTEAGVLPPNALLVHARVAPRRVPFPAGRLRHRHRTTGPRPAGRARV